jgi:hypothetical protein
MEAWASTETMVATEAMAARTVVVFILGSVRVFDGILEEVLELEAFELCDNYVVPLIHRSPNDSATSLQSHIQDMSKASLS